MGEIWLLAGLWEVWKGADGLPLHTFTILTTAANEAMVKIHDRMPVILEPTAAQVWLRRKPPPGDADQAITALITPYPAEQMLFTPVSRLVNSPKNDGPECIQATNDPPDVEQYSGGLFG
jgi:putative SOS response-associated peptidase YedK